MPFVLSAKSLVGLIGQIAQVIVDFLEVAVSCVVFLKGFYPPRKNYSYFVLISACLSIFAICKGTVRLNIMYLTICRCI